MPAKSTCTQLTWLAMHLVGSNQDALYLRPSKTPALSPGCNHVLQ